MLQWMVCVHCCRVTGSTIFNTVTLTDRVCLNGRRTAASGLTWPSQRRGRRRAVHCALPCAPCSRVHRTFMSALGQQLGAPTSLRDFERKAQMLNYSDYDTQAQARSFCGLPLALDAVCSIVLSLLCSQFLHDPVEGGGIHRGTDGDPLSVGCHADRISLIDQRRTVQ